MTTVPRLRRAVAARLHSEDGLSLSEMLVTITISSVVVGAIAAAFIVGTRTSVSANTRLRESHDAQMLNTYFSPDAHNASSFAATGMTGCAVNPGESTVAQFGWTDGAAEKRVFYLRPSATSPELVRRYCASATSAPRNQTLVRNLAAGPGAISVSCTPDCSGVPSLIALTVKELSGYEYTVQTSPRMTTVGASLDPFPTVRSAKRKGATEWTNGSTVEWTVKFSETVTGVDNTDFRLDRIVGGTPTTNVAAVDVFGVAGTDTYTVRVPTGAVDGDLQLNVVDNDSIRDSTSLSLGDTGSGNGTYAGESWKFDKTPSAVSSILRTSGAAATTKTGPLSWTVKFNEPVSNVEIANFSLARTAISGSPAVTSVSASGGVPAIDWIVIADTTGTSGANNSTINLSLSNKGTIRDQATNALASTSTGGAGAQYVYDTTKPVPTVAKAAGQFDPTNVSPVNFTVTFDEPVVGFVGSDVAVSGSAPGTKTVTVTPSGSTGTTYAVSVSGVTGAGTVVVSVLPDAAQDAAGNLSTGPVTGQVTFDPNAETTPTFFVVDTAAERMYLYRASGAPWTPTSSWALHSSNDDADGVAAVGTTVYVLDSDDERIYQYSSAGVYQATSRRLRDTGGSSLGTPTGLAIDGGDLWIVEDRGGSSDTRLLRYSLDEAFGGTTDLRAAASKNAHSSNDDPTGLAIDSNWLYVTDDSDDIVYRYSRSGSGVDTSKTLYDRSGTSSGDRIDDPQGAAVVNGKLWVVNDDGSSSRAFEYNLSSLFPGSGSINASADFAVSGTNPRGL